MDFPAINPRQASILESIVRLYIETALPVGSALVLARSGLNVSPATVRNDMADLEAAGYIASPHTSAGRVPTELAYEYYIAHFLSDVSLPSPEERQLQQITQSYQEFNERVRQLAKAVAGFSSAGVFVAGTNQDIFYTGLTNLFAQPEFREQEQVHAMSQVLDHLDEAMADIITAAPTDNVSILVGSRNPLGSTCSVIITHCRVSPEVDIIFGILGPTRMDYDRNVARSERFREFMHL